MKSYKFKTRCKICGDKVNVTLYEKPTESEENEILTNYICVDHTLEKLAVTTKETP